MKYLPLLLAIPILFSTAAIAHEVYEVDSDGHERKIIHSHERDVDAPYQYRRYPSRSVIIRNRRIIIDRKHYDWSIPDRTNINYCVTLDTVGFVCNNHFINH